MRKVILYIAMSIDGYIADTNNAVSWLEGDGSDSAHLGTYEDFIKTIDTVILGNTTFAQIINELSPNCWVYSNKKTYVITRNNIADLQQIKTNNPILMNEDIHFYNSSLPKLIHTLKNEEGKDIWICGGAKVVNELIENSLIDIYHISIIPLLLGSGIKLFKEVKQQTKLKLISSQIYNGIVDIVYEKR